VTGLLFARPEWLSPLCAGWLALGLALVLAGARGRRRMRKLLGEAAGDGRAARRRPLRDAAPLVAAGAIGLALLGPRFGEGVVEISTSGVDVVLLVDASQSMDAADVPPSRADSARRGAAQLLAGLSPGDRAALAVFAGRGLLLTPLTPDHDALVEMLSAVDSSLVKPGGSNLAAGVESALEAFDREESRPRAVFVLSDGEVFAADGPSDVGAIAATRSDVRVFAAAIGTEEGARVPDHGVPLRDRGGAVVTSRRRTTSLARLADATGGTLFVADEWGRFDVARALAELRAPVAAQPGDFVPHRVTLPVVVPFAAIAFALLLAEWLPFPLLERRGTRRERRAPTARAKLAAVVAASFVLLGANEREPRFESAVEPGSSTPDGPALLAAGLAHAEREAWPDAERAFLAAAIRGGASDVAAIALHNLGVLALARDDFEAAREAFFDSLAAGTPARDARQRAHTQWNLEWVLVRIGPEPPMEQEKTGNDEEAAPREPPAESDTEPPPTPEERPDTAGAAEPAMPEGDPETSERPLDLDEAERERWLARVTDDPRKAMLSAAFDPTPEARSTRGQPTW